MMTRSVVPKTDPKAVLGTLGPYRLIKILGEGGMGRVYLAEDPKLERRIALKVMRPELAATGRQRFLREARTAASIKHDNVVTIHQVGEDDGTPFLAMELLAGESLEDRLRSGQPLPLADILRIGREIAEGLGAAHRHGLIHRDIKPANVFLERRAAASDAPGSTVPAIAADRVKVLDFGLARPTNGEVITQSGAIIGTAGYMAPEQSDGGTVDPRSDLFSLGCVLYRLTAGQPAFKGKDFLATLMLTANSNPTPPAEINAATPGELSDLIMHLLEKDPAKRPASAGAVVAALAAIEESGGMGRPKRMSRRKKSGTMLWLAASGLAVVTLIAVGVWLLKHPAGASPKIDANVDPPVVAPKVVDPTARDREVAHFVLKKGGHVHIIADPDRKPFDTTHLEELKIPLDAGIFGSCYVVDQPAAVPAEPFYVVSIVVFQSRSLIDRDLAWFTDLPELHQLFLGFQDVSDDGIDRLDRLPKVRSVSINSPLISVEGVQRLRNRLGCQTITPPLGRPVTDPGGVNREVADWVFRTGGRVDVVRNAGLFFHEVRARSDLPRQPFLVRGIVLVASNPEVTDEDVKKFVPLADLKRLQIGSPQLTDQSLKVIAGMGELELLYFGVNQFTDESFEAIRGMTKLRTLSVGSAHITDAGLIHFKDLTELNTLVLQRSPREAEWPKITDKGLKHLARMKDLQSLNLMGAAITDTGLADIAEFPLTWLALGNTAVTDEGMKTVAKFPSLTTLFLTGTRVGDPGMAALADMKKLSDLSLEDTAVTDKGLDALCNAPLRSIALKNVRVSPAALARFRQAHPKCIIYQ